MTLQRLCPSSLLILLVAAWSVHAKEDALADYDLATLMTMDVTVTSASRHAQASSDAPAAVFVITRDDIRRSGATSLPEVLRMAPGVQVARLSTRSWSVSSRGSGTRFANKLLVMIDGRSIYTAIFSGVIWEEQSLPLENIERIEVIRGPGGALWGINAVNGVINIITRHAADDPGALISMEEGLDERGADLSYAAASTLLGDYRVYVRHDELDALDERDTDVDRWHAGWRVDRAAWGGDLTFEGEFSDNDFSEDDGLPDSAYHRYTTSGSVLLDWRRALEPGQLELRTSYGRSERSQPGEWDETVFGADAQFTANRLGAHLVTGGFGYRRVMDVQRGYIPALRLLRSRRAHDQGSVYAQDEIHFLQDAARLIVGAKVEHFDSIGVAFQPTLRGIWKYNDLHTFWAAASKALRAPSRFEMHSQVQTQVQDAPFPVIVRMSGDEDLDPERMLAYELGWRWRARETLSFDVALYRNEYDSVIGALELGPQMQFGPAPYLLVPLVYANSIDARTAGGELSVEWQPMGALRLQASAALYDVSADHVGGNLTTSTGNVDPKESYALRARFDPLPDVELDLAWRYVSQLTGLDVPAYDALDARIAWRPRATLELSFSVENALGGQHIEFRDEQAGRETVIVERTFLGRIVWRPAM